jgi:hypothetical protein
LHIARAAIFTITYDSFYLTHKPHLSIFILEKRKIMDPRRLAPVEEKEDNFTWIARFLFPATRVCMAVKAQPNFGE